MKSYVYYFVLIFVIINAISISAQPIKIGANVFLGLPNTITQTGYGFEGFLEYKISQQFSARIAGGPHYASFEKEGLYDNELTQNKYYGLIMYRPINGGFKAFNGIEPYIGIGLGYFTSSYESTHNAQVINGGYLYGVDISDAVGYCTTLGVNFMSGSAFQLMAEFNYTYLKPEYSYVYEGVSPVKVNDKIDLSFTAFRLFFVFEL